MSEENTTETVVVENKATESEANPFENIDTKDMTREEKSIFNKLRDENAKTRIRALEAEKKHSEAEKDFQTRLAAREAEVKLEAQSEARTERAMARLESLATKDGLLDPELVSMIDASTIEFDDAGKIKNAQELIDAFKASKPHLFTAQATSSVAKTPKASVEGAKKATDMAPEEYKALLKARGLSF